MPVLIESIKNYFETLQINANENNQHDLNIKDEIKDIEINGLFTDASVDKALKFINDEFHIIRNMKESTVSRIAKQQLRTLEIMIIIYQIHGKFEEEIKCIKMYGHISRIKHDVEEQNYAYLMEAFYHLIHDSRTNIPDVCIELSKKMILTKDKELNKQSVLLNFAKLIFERSTPDFHLLFNKIKVFYADCQSYFHGSTFDSHLVRIYITHCEFILKVKAIKSGYNASILNFIEDGLLIRKLSMNSIDFMRKKNTETKLYSGSYETIRYLWKFINNLLIGIQLIAEYYTLIGIEKESKQYQNELFNYSVKYCAPYRTKIAIKLFMHSEFIYLRIPELTIRDAQLNQIKTNQKSLNTSLHSCSQRSSIGVDIAEYNYPLNIPENDLLNTPISKHGNNNRKILKLDALYITTSTDKEKEITLDDCFLSRSLFKTDLLDLHNVIKSYIWKIQSSKMKFSVDYDWESNFIEPNEEELGLTKDIANINLSTPPSSPKKCNTPFRGKFNIANLNAPIRVRRNEISNQNKPMIFKKSVKDKENSGDDTAPIESFETVFIPMKTRNIKYEDPEIPRSLLGGFNKISIKDNFPFEGKSCKMRFDNFNGLSLQDDKIIKKSKQIENGPSLITYLEDHVEKFKYLNLPVLHRPVYQRLGLHYLSLNQEKAAYFFSLAIGIGFRQLYITETLMKGKNRKTPNYTRWKLTYEKIHECMKNESIMHSYLKDFLPKNWTVLQFTMIDEIPISVIKSSLLSSADGGCLGARNCAVLLVTKYQNIEVDGEMKLTVETRVLHGFRRTGMQLLDQLENIKTQSTKGLKITERKAWWNNRFTVDSNLRSLINQMRTDWFTDSNIKWLMDEGNELEGEPKIIISDRNICRVPMESILIREETNSKCITRMPNIVCLIGHLYQSRYRHVDVPQDLVCRSNLEIDPMKTFFLVNPDNSLQETEDTVLPLFKKQLCWEGVSGKSDKRIDAFNILSNKDMLIYCGHGAGGRYFMDRTYKSITSPTSLFLIGCQSSRFTVEGRCEAFGMIMYYLTIGCPSVLGLLWDVTDREIDKFTVKMLTNWLGKSNHHTKTSDTYLPVAPMPAYVFDKESIDQVQLKTLTGTSAVIFGLPTWTNESLEIPKFNP